MAYRSLQAESRSDVDGMALSSVKAYPNPAHDRLMITYPSGSNDGTFEILDGRGRVIRSGSLAQYPGFVELDVRAWSDGLYMARILRTGRILGETKFTVLR